MKVASTHTYSASPELVFAVMTQPDVVVAKYRALGHHDVKVVEHTERAGIVSLRTRRAVATDPPGFAKRFFDPVSVVDQHDEWDPRTVDGSRWGIWQWSARGVPVTAGGQLHLTPTFDGLGTHVEITGEVTCPMPIVGGRIASWVGDEVERSLSAEAAFLDGFLHERLAADPTLSPHRRAS